MYPGIVEQNKEASVQFLSPRQILNVKLSATHICWTTPLAKEWCSFQPDQLKPWQRMLYNWWKSTQFILQRQKVKQSCPYAFHDTFGKLDVKFHSFLSLAPDEANVNVTPWLLYSTEKIPPWPLIGSWEGPTTSEANVIQVIISSVSKYLVWKVRILTFPLHANSVHDIYATTVPIRNLTANSDERNRLHTPSVE
jgi:hypothetical protein